MNLNKNVRIFLVFLVIFVVVGYGSALITESTGFQNPSVPVLGSLPLIGAALAFILYYYWARKEI